MEASSIPKFTEFLGYLGKLQAEKRIESFEPVLLEPHGGDLNGFVLIRGDHQKIAELRQTDAWKNWVAFGAHNLMGFGIINCILAEDIQDRMARFQKLAQG
jgi:hypothetical protein